MANANSEASTRVVLFHKEKTPVVGNYGFLFEPRKDKDGGNEKYTMQLLIDKHHPQVKELKAAMKAAKAKASASGKYEYNFRDGDEVDEETGDYIRPGEEYRDRYYLNASTKKPPQVVIGADRELAEEDDWYNGAGVAVSIVAFAYSREGKKGVSWALNNVWIIDTEQPALGGRMSAEKEFESFKNVEVRVTRAKKPALVEDEDEDEDDDLPF